ncbi:putative late blight resistance protein homolog R1B-14 [Henckelia pumila]|uniref:putative late blight resistance protein homolog R1B-14 n=1 Tax=Henckelia pumila TaxID=405737 RepID=UPI003C6E2F65
MKMKNRDNADSSPVNVHSSTVVKNITGNTVVVGFDDDDLDTIKERMYEDSAKLQIIPIVGMGGIGKTTLARRAYEHSLLAQYFDICAWTTMSQEYQKRDVLLELLQHLNKQDNNQRSNATDAQLVKQVYQNLFGRRYLIVIDDIWSTKAWDDLKMIFPVDGSNGSRILLTTRLLDVAIHAGSFGTHELHQMDFLNEDQSWKLLRGRIFGQECCPLHLVEIGKKIARNCGGLPLTIVVVAGLLLSNGNILKQEMWESILGNISSTEPTIALHCSKILCLSYDRLPLRLKPCFLYIAAFPEDSKIDVSKLIRLWVAEGFLKPSDGCKSLEDIGEGYLEDLICRSLILVSKKGPDGKLKTVEIHDMLRDICITKAEEEGFLHRFSSKPNSQKNVLVNPGHRISIHLSGTFKQWQVQGSSVHSVIIFPERNLETKLYLSCRRINILDAPWVTLPNFSNDISSLVRLRYLAFALDSKSCPRGFPDSISKLCNLQTIVTGGVYHNRLEINYKIWSKRSLRHLIINTPFHLLCPSNGETIGESNLQTLEKVIDFRFTEESIKIFKNLKRLKIVRRLHKYDDLYLDNLFRFQKLEELEVKLHFYSNDSRIWNHAFPVSLKKLSLKGIYFLWENMTIIGSLPNLQVLKIINIRHFTDDHEYEEWKPVEGQFLQLKYFHSSLDYVVKWEVEKEHFPSLESLRLMRAWSLHEIPCGIGEIDTLQLIELRKCRISLVNSAKLLQKQQHENGNIPFQLRIVNGTVPDSH